MEGWSHRPPRLQASLWKHVHRDAASWIAIGAALISACVGLYAGSDIRDQIEGLAFAVVAYSSTGDPEMGDYDDEAMVFSRKRQLPATFDWDIGRGVGYRGKGAYMSERLETLTKARARMIEDRDTHAKVLAAPFDRDKAERARNKFIEIQALIDALDRAISGEQVVSPKNWARTRLDRRE
jgi:hypothetical protein